MTGGAVIAKLALVGVIGSVAGGAGGRRVFVGVVSVTIFALGGLVSPGERKTGPGVVKRSGLPAGGGVANSAIAAELPLMGVRFGVASGAVLGRVFEHLEGGAAGMTVLAGKGRVLAGQGKGNASVIKRAVVRVEAIMAVQAIFPKSLEVELRIGVIQIGVADHTGILIDTGQAFAVAVAALKSGAAGMGGMPFE